MSEVLDNLEVQYTYHVHTGSAGATSNGCYTKAVYHTHISTCYYSCSGQLVFDKTYQNTGCYHCNKCNRDYYLGHPYIYGDAAGNTCGTQLLGCAKNGSTIDRYTVGCGKTEETIESVTIIY